MWRRAVEVMQGVLIVLLLAAFTALIFAALVLRTVAATGR